MAGIAGIASADVGLGVAAGGFTAVAYGLGSVLQAVAARRSPTAANLDPRLFLRLLGHWQYGAGLALDGLGFVANVVALHWLPLFAVQCLIAGSVGVTAIAAAVWLDVRVTRPAGLALGGLLGGLALLAGGALPGPARSLSPIGEWLALAAALVLLGFGLVAGRFTGRTGLLTLAATAGAAFGGVGVSARGLPVTHPFWHIVTHPALWAIAVFGVLGTLALALALQRGSVTVASAVMFAVETTIPAGIGLALLGDRTRPGAGVILAGSGFALTLAGSIGLAGYGDLESSANTSGDHGPVGSDLS